MANYSYSKLDTYQQCGFKYYLQYEQGHYLYSDSIATEIGTLIHATEEAIAKSIIAKEPINYIALKNNFITKIYELKHKYPEAYFELDKSGRLYDEKVYQYLQQDIYCLEQYMQMHPTYEIVGVEQAFEVKYDAEHTFKGYIDRVFHDTATNSYIIQDIKTYAIPVEKSSLATPLQFVIYTLAAEQLYGCRPEQIQCQYYLPFCQLTQDAGTSGYLTRGKTKLDKIFTAITNNEFTPNATPLCHWCNFCPTNPNAPEEGKYLCPYFSHWTREQKTFAKENDWQGMDKHAIILENYQNKLKNIV